MNSLPVLAERGNRVLAIVSIALLSSFAFAAALFAAASLFEAFR